MENSDPRDKSRSYLILIAAAVVMMALGVVMAVGVLITDASNRDVCWQAECLRSVATLFEIPTKLALTGLLLLAAAYALERLRIAQRQEAERVQQITRINYHDFRSEFLMTFERWVPGQFNVLHDLTPAAVFNSLYPQARHGDQTIAEPIREILTDSLPQAFEAMSDVSPTDPARYDANSYEPIRELYDDLRRFIVWDAEVNFRYRDPLMCSPLGDAYAGSAKDILSIASAVNEFEGMPFFDNEQRQRWRVAVDRLFESVEHSNLLEDFWQNLVVTRWRTALVNNDLDSAGRLDVLSRLGRLTSNETARQYVYQTLTTEPEAIPSESRNQAAVQLKLVED